MKQVLQNAAGSTFVRDVPNPPCPPPNVLVRNEFSVISSGTERSRVEAGQKSLVGRVRERPELALKAVERIRKDGLRETRDLIRRTLEEEGASGYSTSGIVVEVGSAVRGLSVGDRVACAGAGHANHAEVVSVPRNLCALVPDGVPMESAALTTIASIALHGIRLADVRLGESVAVVGCGLVGQIACRLLRASGATVIALDIDPVRIETALASGADHSVLVAADAADKVRSFTGGGTDHAIVTAGSSSSEPLVLAGEVARDRGTVVLVGAVPIDVPRALLYDKELAFRVSRSYGPGRYDADYEERGIDYPIAYVRWTEQRNMQAILELQAAGKLSLRDLIEDVIPIDDAEAAYARLGGNGGPAPRGALAFSYPVTDVQAAPAEPQRPPAPTEGGVRIGLLGPGGFASGVLVPAFAATGATLAVVGGGSGPSAEAMTRKGSFARAAASEAELIADPGVNAVVIATRHGSHASLSRAALDAGKHVFCEKPLALDAAELDDVLSAASTAERVLTVGFNRRFAPHIRALREFIAPVDGPLSLVYRVSAGHVPPASWLHDLESGGGRIIGECCHFLDVAAYLTASSIAEVHARGFGSPELPLQAHDNVMISATLADGSVATIAYLASGSPGVPKERLEVFGGTRTAVLDDFTSLDLFDGDKHTKDRLRAQDKGHTAEVREFVTGVREGRMPIPLDTIANVHRACFAVIESLRTGVPARVDG
jgi:predicted dehydrogenase/threonine dehydrogenase-like Zn-dependent dehydrogenase